MADDVEDRRYAQLLHGRDEVDLASRGPFCGWIINQVKQQSITLGFHVCHHPASESVHTTLAPAQGS